LASEELDPNKYKWFVQGEHVPFQSSILLTPAKFTRGFVKVEIEDLDLAKQQLNSENLVWIQDYTRKRYLSKRRLAALNSHKLTEYEKEE